MIKGERDIAQLEIIIRGYSKTTSVFINDHLVEPTSIIENAVYKSDLLDGPNHIKVIKNPEIYSRQWRKKWALNWLSLLFNNSYFTLKEAVCATQKSCIEFTVEIKDPTKLIIEISKAGIRLRDDDEVCNIIQNETAVDPLTIKRVKLWYLLPVILLSVVIVGLLLTLSIFLATSGAYLYSIITTLIAIFLSAIFIYSYKNYH